jgi:malate synthase
MGGMSAFIPVKGDEAANPARWKRSAPTSCAKSATAMTAPGSRTRAGAGRAGGVRCDAGPNQLSKMPDHVPGRDEMLELHEGPRTEAGARENIRVGVQYLAAWLGGKGAVPLYNLMEDAATAEICRTQLWQWLQFEAPLDDGRTFTRTCSTQCSTKRSACCRKFRTSPTRPSSSARWSSQTTLPSS